MLSNDYSFEEYFQDIGELDDLITSVLIKKKTFLLSERLKSDVSDHIDLVNKFIEIKTILTTIDFEKLTSEAVSLLIDQLKVLQKIINILNEDSSYSKSAGVITTFHKLLESTIIRIQYVEDIKQTNYISRANYNPIQWTTKNAMAINQEKFIELIKFVKSEFLLTDMNQISIQNTSDQAFVDLFILIAYIYKNLNLDAIYSGSHLALKKYIYVVEDNSSQFKNIHVLHDNSLFQDRIPKILEGLEKLYEKVVKSSKKEVRLGSWSFGDFGLKDLQEILSQF